MSTTAALEVAATLGATSPSADRGLAVASPESGEAFNKVLNELTAKASDESGIDKRDSMPKSTKRVRVPNAPILSPPAATSLEAARVAEVHGSADTRGLTLRADVKATDQPPSAPATSNDDLAGSWRVPSRVIADEVLGTHSPADGEGASSTTIDESATSSAAVSATIANSSSAVTTLLERAMTEIKNDDVIGVDGKSPAVPGPSVNSASSIGVTTSVTPAAAAITSSTLSEASAAIRTALPEVANATPSRTSAAHSDQSTSSSADMPAPTRHTEGVSPPTDRAVSDLVAGPNVGSNARATMNAAPNVSSDTEPSSLDVSELATSISQATLGSNGSYTINVAMHPSDLGHVQAVVSLNGIDLHVAITPQTPMGHAALANAVESLKSELSRSGLNVNVSLRDPESRSGRGNEDASRVVPIEADVSSAKSEAPPVSEALSASQIHLIL